MKKVQLLLQVLICLKNNLKMDIKALDKDLTQHFSAVMINLHLVGCLCSFGSQYICGSLLPSLKRFNLNLFSRIVWLLLIISVLGLKV